MSSFRSAVMTDAGAALMAEAFAEGFQIEFVKMVTGSGVYEENEKTATELRVRTELKDKRQEAGFSSIMAAEGNTVQLKALITNESLDAGYRMTEVGVIAKKEGADSQEILYSIAVAEEADYLPSKENPIEIIQEYYTKVANTENVTINVSMGAVAVAEDMMRVLYPEYNEPEEMEELENREDIFSAFGKIGTAIKRLISHIENGDNPHQDVFVSNYQQATGYTDQKIADLINGAPETLDTLKEIADAMAENESVVEALEEAIGNRASEAEFESHVGNNTIHITAEERSEWSGKLSTTGDTANNTTTFTSADSTSPTGWTDVAQLQSKEKHSSIFNKISTMFKNVRWLYKMLGTTDISTIGGGTVTGALNALNTNLSNKQDSSTAITTSNIGSQSVNYANSAANADTVDGYHVCDDSCGNIYGKIPVVKSDGVMKIGRYMDWHFNGDNVDYTGRTEFLEDGSLRHTKYILAEYFKSHSGAIFNGDGNVYMPWAGDWLSNVLNTKLNTTASCNRNWNWSGQGGQPTWLWGGEDGTNMYVYNPANFSVHAASYAYYGANNEFSCGNARMYHNSEGGNFKATAPNGVAHAEMDAWDSDHARLYYSADGVNEKSSIRLGSTDIYLRLGGASAGHICYNGTAFYTTTSNKASLGGSSNFWTTLYAKTGTINTSDRTKKHDIKDLTDAYEQLFLKLQPKSFIFNDGDRVHIGAISQDVEETMNELGIEPKQFAGFCKDIRYEYIEYEDDGTPIEESRKPVTDEDGNYVYDYSLRYQEFIFLTIHMVQKLYGRVELLEKDNSDMRTSIDDLKEQLQSMQKEIAELKEQVSA